MINPDFKVQRTTFTFLAAYEIQGDLRPRLLGISRERQSVLTLNPETLSRSVQLTIVSPKCTKMQKTRLLQFARNANVISQGLAWTALERCEDGE